MLPAIEVNTNLNVASAFVFFNSASTELSETCKVSKFKTKDKSSGFEFLRRLETVK